MEIKLLCIPEPVLYWHKLKRKLLGCGLWTSVCLTIQLYVSLEECRSAGALFLIYFLPYLPYFSWLNFPKYLTKFCSNLSLSWSPASVSCHIFLCCAHTITFCCDVLRVDLHPVFKLRCHGSCVCNGSQCSLLCSLSFSLKILGVCDYRRKLSWIS